MKYCLSALQPENILKKADEIKIRLKDYRAIPDYVDKYPDKTLILDFTNIIPEGFNWDLIQVYSEKMNGNFHCALNNLYLADECISRGIKFYYKYAVTSFFELEGLKKMGVSYILVGIPLIFDLKNVASYEIPMRAVPNLAYEPYIKHNDGICGGWIRPEDTDIYGQYIDVFEFSSEKLEKEQALYHVYAENKKWPGNLNLLIDNLNVDFDNKVFYDEENFAKRRMNCKQKCLSGYSCHYCSNQLHYIQDVLLKYKSNKELN